MHSKVGGAVSNSSDIRFFVVVETARYVVVVAIDLEYLTGLSKVSRAAGALETTNESFVLSKF